MARHRARQGTRPSSVAKLAVALVGVVVIGLLARHTIAKAAPVADGAASARIESQFLALDPAASHPSSAPAVQRPRVPYVPPPLLNWAQELPLVSNQEMAASYPSSAPIAPPMPPIAASVLDQRGQILSVAPVPGLSSALRDAAGAVQHATYWSVSGLSGEATQVSGMFFIPKGTPPAGGWPVISFAHGTTGMTTDCAPSLREDLFGYGSSVASFLSGGVAVAFTDYEGLGGPGLHPYLEPRTAGFNVIDAVRALRSLFPDVSTRWLSFGMSQGGQASWAANEENGFYGGGLDLLGSVALAPAVNITALGELAYSQQLTPEQQALMPLAVMGVERSFPSAPLDHLLHGRALDQRDVLIGCGVTTDEMRASLTAADVKPGSRTDTGALTQSLRMLALPREPLSAPLLVASGSADQLLFPAWIRSAVMHSCEMGGTITYFEEPGAKHADVVADARVISWMTDRIAGRAAPSTCSTMSDVVR